MSTIVIMPGGFHPFHAGHAALYQSAVEAFPGAEVFVAATNDTSTRPFPFAIKEKLAKLAGVKPGSFVQVKSPFRAEEITAQFDPAKDRLIFVRSEKDVGKPPQAGGNKKDGSPAYLQPLAGQTNIRPFKEHAYMAYLPTVEFGPGMTSATEIRTAWPQLNDKRKQALVMSLYPQTQSNPALAKNVVKMLDTAIGTETTDLNEAVGGNYLYHSTEDAATAKAILQSGVFKAGFSGQTATDAQVGETPNISFGRNLAYQINGANVGRDYQVVFVVNRGALESKYKTIGTSQSGDIRGLGYGSGIHAAKQQNQNPIVRKQVSAKTTANRERVDTNKDGKFSQDEIEANSDLYRTYVSAKAGNEFEEVVPTRTGTIPWQGMLVGFYLVPGKAAAKDPELLNHPLRLEMPSPNNFVRANGTAPANKPVLTPAQRQQQKQAGQEKSRQMAMTKVTAESNMLGTQPTFQVSSYDDFNTAFEVEMIIDNNNAGFFSYQYFPETNDVENDVDIHSDQFRGQGYGKMLLLKAIETAQEHNLPFKVDRNGVTPAQGNVYRSLLADKIIRINPDKTIIATGRSLPGSDMSENQGWAATFTSEETGQMAGTPAIGGMWAGYQARENQPIDEDYIDEKWSQKYKSSINCASPKGFSQRAHCAGRKK
jgi:hypothetical protein